MMQPRFKGVSVPYLNGRGKEQGTKASSRKEKREKLRYVANQRLVGEAPVR